MEIGFLSLPSKPFLPERPSKSLGHVPDKDSKHNHQPTRRIEKVQDHRGHRREQEPGQRRQHCPAVHERPRLQDHTSKPDSRRDSRRENLSDTNGPARRSRKQSRDRRRVSSQRRATTGRATGCRFSPEVWKALRCLGPAGTRERGSETDPFEEPDSIHHECMSQGRSQVRLTDDLLLTSNTRISHRSVLLRILEEIPAPFSTLIKPSP